GSALLLCRTPSLAGQVSRGVSTRHAASVRHMARCKMKDVAYPEQFIAPMREDLTRFGVEETRTPEEVDRLLAPGSGTVMIVINSVCGCAAGKARPAVGMALQHHVKPDRAATVFAGGDEAAVAHVRK